MGNRNSADQIEHEDLYTEKTNVIFKSEDQISNFEKNIILNFNSLLTEKFTNIYNYFCCDYSLFQSVQSTRDLFKEVFGVKFLELIDLSGYFKLNQSNKSLENLNNASNKINEKTDLKKQIDLNNEVNINMNAQCCYDLNKLRLLVFLLTKETFVTNNGFNYNDRALFLFEYLSTEDTTNVKYIEFSDPKIDECLGCMFDISSLEIIKFFSKEKELQYENHIKVISKIREKVILDVKEFIFKYAFEDDKRITYQEFYQIFLENYNETFLSSSFFRKITYSLLRIDSKTKSRKSCCW